MIDSSVVLPAPLGPTTATSSPASASKLTSRERLELAVALGEPADVEDGAHSSPRGALPQGSNATWRLR